jgi:hypothetical protein
MVGERPEDFGTTTGSLERMESDLSHGQDRIFEMAVNLKTVITAMGQAAYMVAQKAMQDRLMSGGVHDAI